jgi:cyclic nucleotide-binding protein
VIERFQGETGRAVLIEALLGHALVAGSPDLARAMADRLSLIEVPAGHALVEQGAGDDDIYIILAGSFAIEVNGRRISTRGTHECVGEMAATLPSLPRSATVSSPAAIASTFNCKKVHQLSDGGSGGRTIYLATAVWPMRIPSLRSSPWMRGAPQSGLAALIWRIKALTWPSTRADRDGGVSIATASRAGSPLDTTG